VDRAYPAGDVVTPRVREVLRGILDADVLEDRLEYDAAMLAESYDLSPEEAEELYAALRRQAEDQGWFVSQG
jgi:hypothetical protein